MCANMQTQTHIDIFLLDSAMMRDVLLPSPQRCWDLLMEFILIMQGEEIKNLL